MDPNSGSAPREDLVTAIITSTPEVLQDFDHPDYITLDPSSNEDILGSYLVEKSTAEWRCAPNAVYINDHDYLEVRISKITPPTIDNFNEHNYVTNEEPACSAANVMQHFCNICQKDQKNFFALNRHMMVHTQKNHVTCTVCYRSFLTTNCLHNHILEHTERCEVCGAQVPIVQLKNHHRIRERQRRDLIGKFRVPKLAKEFYCIVCMKSYLRDEVAYLRHLKKHCR